MPVATLFDKLEAGKSIDDFVDGRAASAGGAMTGMIAMSRLGFLLRRAIHPAKAVARVRV